MQNADFTATAVHYAVENEAREAIRKIDGTMPEDLPTPEKSIAQLEKEQMQRLKQKAIDGQMSNIFPRSGKDCFNADKCKLK